MTVHRELSEFLMHDMAGTLGDFNSESDFAFAVLTNIAIAGDDISESFLKLYTGPARTVVDEDLVDACIAYFHGSEVLSVVCDCHDDLTGCLVQEIVDSSWYDLGANDKAEGSALYNRAVESVSSLRDAIFN